MTPRMSVRAQARERYCELAGEKGALRSATATPQAAATPDPPSRRFGGQAPNPSPQPKSDLSDFGRLQHPNSGEPEFGWGGEQPAAPDLTARVRALYEDTAVPVREIARLIGVTERTVYGYARKHRWKPRYRWMPDGSRPPGRPARRRLTAYAPVKGAGGCFIRRDDRDKPFATGLKALDPAGRARALAGCAQAEPLAQAAQAEAEAAARREARIFAMAWVSRASCELSAYLAERAPDEAAPEEAAPPTPDPMERLLRRTLDLAMQRWETLMAEEEKRVAAVPVASPLKARGE